MPRFYNLLPSLYVLLTLFGLMGCKDDSPQTKGGPFPDKPYAKVVAYEFEDYQGKTIIDKNGQLNPSVERERELTAEQVQSLLQLVNSPDSYGGTVMRCFIPRLGFVFYDNENKPVSHLSICMECNSHVALPEIGATSPATGHGYSVNARRSLIEFCQSLGFEGCNKVRND